MALWHYGITALRRYGFMALWFCRYAVTP